MVKKQHPQFEKEIISHFATGFNCNVVFESYADIQGTAIDGSKVIGEFKSEAEHKKNYKWWSDWKDRLENYYSEQFTKMQPKNKRWLAVVDGQLREYCQLEGIGTGYLVVENYMAINSDIIEALDFLKSEQKIVDYYGPTRNTRRIGHYKINY